MPHSHDYPRRTSKPRELQLPVSVGLIGGGLALARCKKRLRNTWSAGAIPNLI
jgi:hypothetical protein